MIRIVDEPIYSMTCEEYNTLMEEYYATYCPGHYHPTFETWLKDTKKRPYTTYREENP